MPPVDFDKLADKVIFHATENLGRGEIVYKPKKGGEYIIRGVFDDRAEQVDPDTEQVISTNIFTLGIRLADLPDAPAKGDRVGIGSDWFRVIDCREDGVPGVSAVLYMHKV